MPFDAILLWSSAVIGTVAAVGSVVFRGPLLSALFLVLALLSTAGLYLALAAEFVAVIQVIVYAGAIMVLFVFVIMLMDDGRQVEHGTILAGEWDEQTSPTTRHAWASVVAAIFLMGTLSVIILRPDDATPLSSSGFGSVRSVSLLMISEYYWIFQLIAILLLVAMVGAVVISRYDAPRGDRRSSRPNPDEPDVEMSAVERRRVS